MQYYTIPPPAHLAQYVRSFWVLQHGGAYIYRSLADGCAEMVFHYDGVYDEIMPSGNVESSFKAGIHGQSRKVRRFVTQTGFGIFGVYLYPFALRQLLNIPAHALSDEMPDLATLLGAEGRELQEKIMLAHSNRERVDIMVPFFERKIGQMKARNAPMIYAVKNIIHSSGQTDIDRLATDCYLSRRQFERNFKEHAGFSPKLYMRIIRFQAAAKAYGMEYKSLTDIAYQCGYYDQAHFIHDFKEFSGFEPREYFYGKPEGMDYRDAREGS